MATGAAVVASGPLLGVAAGGLMMVGSIFTNVYAMAWAKRSEVRLPHPERGQLHLTLNQVHEVRIVPRPAGTGWALEVPYAAHRLPEHGLWERIRTNTNLTMGRMVLEGADAERTAGILLPRINGAGAPGRRVREAVEFIETEGGPERLFATAAGRTREWGRQQMWGDTGALRFLPAHVRLALEMAAHEDTERLAMEGELAALERAWRDAEEVAAIADALLVPDEVRARIARERGEDGGKAGREDR